MRCWESLARGLAVRLGLLMSKPPGSANSWWQPQPPPTGVYSYTNMNTEALFKVYTENYRKKQKGEKGRGAIWLSPAQSRQKVSSGCFWPKFSEVEGRCCQSIPTHQLKKGSSAPAAFAVSGPLSILWLHSPPLTSTHRKLMARTMTTLCPTSPSTARISLANNILFLCTFTSKQFGTSQAKIIFKS